MDIEKEYNTEEKLSENEFGYLSVHLILKLKESWSNVPTLSQFSNLKAEVQVRTLSQHSWAEVSNLFQYKTTAPKPLSRSISRISALLELVDLEYERLFLEREKYKKEMRKTASEKEELGKLESSGNYELDVDMLESVLDIYFPKENKSLIEEDYQTLLIELKILGFSSLEAIRILLKENMWIALEEDKNLAKVIQINTGINQSNKKINNGIFYTHVGLMRKILNHKFGRPYEEVIDEVLINQ